MLTPTIGSDSYSYDVDAACRIAQASPWPTALVDSRGQLVAVSASARVIAGITAGMPVDMLLPAAGLEVDILSLPSPLIGWQSINFYAGARAHALEQVMLALGRNIADLLAASSIQTLCERLTPLLSPSGIAFSLYVNTADGAISHLYHSTPVVEYIRLAPAALQQAFERQERQIIPATAIEALHALALGVRGHLLMLLGEAGSPKQVLHLWGSMVTPDSIDALEPLIHNLAALFAQVAERQNLARRVQRYGALSIAANVIASLGEVDDVLREICSQALTLMETAHASAYLPAKNNAELVCAMAVGHADWMRGSALPLRGSLVGRAFREGQTLVISDVEAEPDVYRPVSDIHRLRSALLQPLRRQGEAIGVLCVARQDNVAFNDDERMMLARFAELAAAAVTNARLHNALQQSERRYRTLFEQAGELLFSITPSGIIRRSNYAVANVLGIESQQLVGTSLFDLMDADYAADLRQRLTSLLAGRRFIRSWTFEIRGKQGRIIALETSAQVVWSGTQAVEVDLICHDVTARRAAAHELQRRQMELTTLVRISQAINRSLELDQVLKAALETIASAGLGSAVTVILHEDDGRLRLRASHNLPQRFIEVINRQGVAPLTGEMEALTQAKPVIIAEETLRHERMAVLAPGDIPAGHLVVIPLLFEGAAIGLLEFTATSREFDQRDIQLAEAIATQLVQAITNARINQELRETSLMNARLYREAEAMRAYLDAIIQNTPDILLVCRPDLSIQPINQGPLQAVGHQRQDLAGQSLLTLVPGEHHGELTRYWFLARTGVSQRFDIQLLRGDGTHFSGLVSMDLIPDYNEVLLVIKDVTELHQLEARVRQNEKLAALGRLVAGAAHELNNPLAVILGLSQLQLSENVPPPVRADLEQIERAARRAAAIVQQLRMFGQPAEADAEALDLPLIVGDAIQRLGAEIRSAQIDVTLDLPPDLPAVAGVMHQIEQVVFNITRNAVQALTLAPQLAHRRLHIHAAVEASDVILAIADTGPGIAPEHVHKVFEPFFTTREVGQGMGMGLAIVYSIVQQHGGDVWVESQFGRGTTFRIRLPQAHNLAAPVTVQPAPTPLALSVLLVEDDTLVRSVAQRALQRMECRVEAVGRAEDAFVRALAGDYSLIITDLQMPGMDGVELYDRLHVIRPSLRWLVLTGDTMGERSSAFLARTNLPVLNKPFTYEQLVASVTESLR